MTQQSAGTSIDASTYDELRAIVPCGGSEILTCVVMPGAAAATARRRRLAGDAGGYGLNLPGHDFWETETWN